VGRLLDIAVGLLAHIIFHGPELGFLVCIGLPFGPKPYRSWRQMLGSDQLVASDTRANRSVSITINSQRPGSSVFICPVGGITLIVTVLEKRIQSPGVRVQSGESLRGSRAFERRTVPPMTMLNVALSRSCEAVVRKPRRLSYTPDLELLQR
jgi:hypothetical protein